MPHEVDRHLVACQIYLARVDKELGRVPTDVVLKSRQRKLAALIAQIKRDIDALEEVRTGRKGDRPKPRTLAEVSDLDAYIRDFVPGGSGGQD